MDVEFTLRYDSRPWTLNGERKLHPKQRAKLVREWREAFWLLAHEAHVPRHLTDVAVIATPFLSNRRGMQDVGAAFPAAKAAIDGLVDAGVLVDDDPRYLKYLGFHAPVIGRGDGLELTVRGQLTVEVGRKAGANCVSVRGSSGS